MTTTVDRAVATAGRAGLSATACVRICDPFGEVVGSGFLVGPELVATCAHVVAEALEARADAPRAPEGSIAVDFPVLGEAPGDRSARVARWSPIAADGGGDIALLRLDGRAPAAAVMPPVRGETGSRWDDRFRIFGFPDGHGDGVWTSGRIRGLQGTGWLQLRGDPGDHPVVEGFSGSPVWDDEVGAVIGMTVAADRLSEVTTAFMLPIGEVLGLDPELLPCPYRGPEPFGEEHAELFHGRGPELARLREALDRGPLAAVAGPSGAGKSSLLRAGLAAELREAGVPVAEVGPDPPEQVLVALAGAVLQLAEPRSAPARRDRDSARIGALLATPDGRADGVAELAAALSGTGRVVLLLDQFEELVEIASGRARALLDVVAALTAAPEAQRLQAVLTVRARALDEVLSTETARALGSGTVLVGPLDQPRLRETIERPAAVAPGLVFEDGLVEQILADADPGPGQLPLVQALLVRLWHQRSGGMLTLAGYDDAGGVAGALAGHADRAAAIAAVGPEADRELDALLLRLVALDDDGVAVRRAVRYRDLPDPQRELVAVLVAHRLVTLSGHGGDAAVEVSHQSLSEHWPRLRRLIDDDRDFLAWRTELCAARQRWLVAGRDTGALLRGAALIAAERHEHRHDELTDDELEFLDTSRAQRRREVRRRWSVVAALTTAVAVAASVSVVAVRGQLDERDRQAAVTLARESDVRAPADPVLATELAAAAWQRAPDEPAAIAALGARYAEMAGVTGLAGPAPPASVSGVDGVEAAGSGEGATMHVVGRDVEGRLTRSLVAGALGPDPRRWDLPAGEHDSVQPSSDGRWFVLLRRDGGVELVDTTSPPATTPAELAGPGSTGSVRFTPDSTRLGWVDRAPSGERAVVREHDLRTGATRTLPIEFGAQRVSVQLLDDPDLALVRAETGPAQLRDVGSGAALATVPQDAQLALGGAVPRAVSCAVGPDSRPTVSVTAVGVPEPARTVTLRGGQSCRGSWTSSDGNYLLVADPSGRGQQRWRATELATGRQFQFRTPHLDTSGWAESSAVGISVAPGGGEPVALVAGGSAVLRVPLEPAPPGAAERGGQRYPTTGSDVLLTVDSAAVTSSDPASAREFARRPGIVGDGSSWVAGHDLWALSDSPAGWTVTGYGAKALENLVTVPLAGGQAERDGVDIVLETGPDGRAEALLSQVDGVLAAYDPGTGEPLAEPIALPDSPQDAEWFASNTELHVRPGHPGQAIVGTPDGRLQLWDVPGRELLVELPAGADTGPRLLTVSEDRVVVRTGAGVLQVWDLDSGALVADDLAVPSLHRLSGLTTDGRLVAYSSGGDGPDGVLVYDLDRGTSTAALPVTGYGRVVVRPDDTVLVEGTLYALPQILSLDPLVWHATLCQAVAPDRSPALPAISPDGADHQPCS